MNVKKIKSKTVKDYVINDNTVINVVTITDNRGMTKKFYNIKTGKTFGHKDIKSNNSFFIGSEYNLTQNDPNIENILSNIDSNIEMLQEMKEIFRFVKNESDIAFEREEKLKRLIK